MKGNIAKEQVTKTIANAFGNSYLGVFDKKIYVWAEEDGEKVQIAITLTCPKNPIVVNQKEDSNETEENNLNVDISPEDKAQIDRLKTLLGITPQV